MAEQQLVDYIKKAREAGQPDTQTRNLLFKNGWTAAEVDEAVAALSQPDSKPIVQVPAQPQPQVQPQAQPQPQVQPTQSNMPRLKTKSHALLKILIVLIIIIVLAGVGYFVAGQYINLPWNPFNRPSPEIVLGNMMTNMKNVKSSHTTMQADISVTNTSTKTSEGELKLDTNSESDITNINSPKADGNFTINLTSPGFGSQAVSASANMVAADGAYYLKLNNITIPDIYSSSGFNSSVAPIKGVWLKIDQDSINAIYKAESTGVEMPAPSISQANNSALTKQIQDLVLSENIISINKQLNDEVISGQNTYHYSATITKAKLEELLNEIITLEMQQSTASQPLAANMAQAFAKTLVDAIGDINLEIWIGQKDFLLYQVKMDKTIDLSKILSSFGASSQIANMQLGVKLTTTNSNFNKAISVQAPASSQKIENVILPLLKTQQGTSADLSKIGSIASTIFSASGSFASLCQGHALNTGLQNYGNDLINASNDMISRGAKKPGCFSDVNNYCISTQLADGSFSCIDKSNAIGTTKCTSAQTVCK